MYDEWCIDQQLNVLSCINATKYYQYELCQTCTPREMTQQREMTELREMTQPREMAIARADSAVRDDSVARDDSSAYYTCTTRWPLLSFQLHRLFRVLKLY